LRFGLGWLCVLVPIFSGQAVLAGGRELATVEAATDVLQGFVTLQLKMIPPALLHDAQGIAIIPNVLKAGFVVGGRFGRGVVLAREPDGTWSNPMFVTLAGGGIGWQIGVQATDLVLVFRTRNGLNRLLMGKGKLTLGADVSVAAGPLGRQAEAATDALLRAEIFSYSRTRGLFAGLSVEGAGILIDHQANESFYHLPECRPAAENLRGLVASLTNPPLAPAPVFSPAPAIIPLGPPAPPPSPAPFAPVLVPQPLPAAPAPVVVPPQPR